MLVVMVCGISSSLQYPLAAYATDGITLDFLYSIVWGAVQTLHSDAGLRVLFIFCDGASPNRKFFMLHSENANNRLYKTINIFSGNDRDLYFISDAPHLLKTTHNCFSNPQYHYCGMKETFPGVTLSGCLRSIVKVSIASAGNWPNNTSVWHLYQLWKLTWLHRLWTIQWPKP